MSNSLEDTSWDSICEECGEHIDDCECSEDPFEDTYGLDDIDDEE